MSTALITSGINATYSGRLIGEWARLRADPLSSRAVTRWAALHPALAGAQSLVDLENLLDSRRTCNDPAWAALITLAKAGDTLATRTLLQALLPQLCGIARRCSPTHTRGDNDEALAQALAGVIDLLRTYRLATRHNHSANLALAGLQHLVRKSTPHRPTDLSFDELNTSDLPERLIDDEDRHRSIERRDQLQRLLASARTARVISADETRLLRRLYLDPSPALSIAQLADRTGTTAAALRQQHSRALRKLRTALTGPLTQPMLLAS